MTDLPTMWLAAAASAAREHPPIFFLDGDWWAWHGWPAVAAIGQLVAAGATLGTLWFFWQQLKGIRDQTRREIADRWEDRRGATTPYVSIEAHGVGRRDFDGQEGLGVSLWVHVDGVGPAYNLTVNLSLQAEDSRRAIASIRFMRAPGSKVVRLRWLADPNQMYPVHIDVFFRSMFGKAFILRHNGILSEKELRISEPEFREVVGPV